MGQLKATTNAEAVIAQLDAYLGQVSSVAVPRALNKLRDQAKVAGMRELARIYGIPVRKVDDAKYLTLSDATSGDLESSITVRGKGFPLFDFSPSPAAPQGRSSRKNKGSGVSVTIKGRRFTIAGAFIARMANGHIGVFARGAYGGKGLRVAAGRSFGRFQFGRSRLPINELFSLGPPEAFRNEEVTNAMDARVSQQAAAVFAAEVRFATR